MRFTPIEISATVHTYMLLKGALLMRCERADVDREGLFLPLISSGFALANSRPHCMTGGTEAHWEEQPG